LNDLKKRIIRTTKTNQQRGDDQYFVLQRPGDFLHQFRTILGDHDTGIFTPRTDLQNRSKYRSVVYSKLLN